VRPFRRWPPWMQRVMAWVVVGLFAVALARCLLDFTTYSTEGK